MKSITIPAVVFTAFATASAAYGQAPAPAAPASPPAATAATASTPAPAAMPPRLDQKPPARTPRAAIVDADARNCLEFSSNYEVIKCAEKYLHRRSG